LKAKIRKNRAKEIGVRSLIVFVETNPSQSVNEFRAIILVGG